MDGGRGLITAVGVVSALLLAYLWNPWFSPEPDTILRTVVTIAFWVSLIVLLVLLYLDRHSPESEVVEVEGPSFARYLLSNSRAGLFWLPIRLFLGIAWLDSGLGKALGEGWLDGGSALRAYWERAVSIPEAPARPPITYEWYRDFINMLLTGNHEGWFSYVIVFGEIAVGIGLIVGMLTGIAAFFGAFMNMSFLLAGTASSNPVLFTMAIGLILAWRVAGYYGVDRWLLPMLGTPWRAPVAVGPPPRSPATG
jgi:thiosulfate dehydrogenase (quinone) large subunit